MSTIKRISTVNKNGQVVSTTPFKKPIVLPDRPTPTFPNFSSKQSETINPFPFLEESTIAEENIESVDTTQTPSIYMIAGILIVAFILFKK
jgi:hypothetical protein